MRFFSAGVAGIRPSAFLLQALTVVTLGQRVPIEQEQSTSYWTFDESPVQDVLNCEGKHFGDDWSDFRRRTAEAASKGFPKDKALGAAAARLLEVWDGRLDHGSSMHARVLMGMQPASKLEGFCLYGYCVAHFILYRFDLQYQHLEIIAQAMGWDEWPLDFMESSEWPPLWRLVPLHLENGRRSKGLTSWSRQLSWWGDDARLFHRPTVSDFQLSLRSWIDAAHDGGSYLTWWHPPGDLGGDCARQLRRRLAEPHRGVWLAVIGHHVGSSMEPFYMARRALLVGGAARVEGRFYGQRHPKPQLICNEFGYCDEKNQDLEKWFMRYEYRWLGEYEWMTQQKWGQASAEFAEIVGADYYIRRADLLICGGPFWVCTMLRSARPAPMLLYFAWPAINLLPEAYKPHLLAQLQLFGQLASPPTVMIVANHILAAQFAYQAHIEVPVQRPHGLYTNASYAPVVAENGKHKVMVTRVGQWAQKAGIALLEVTLKLADDDPEFPFYMLFLSVARKGYPDTTQAFTYAQFAEFYACVFWPWDVMMLLFNELYTMTVPLLVPESRWMYTLIHHSLTLTPYNWWHIRGNIVRGGLPSVSMHDYPLPYKPWITTNGTLSEAAYWYELTDFAQFPHITYFSSLPDMMSKLQALDVSNIRAGMKQFNKETLTESLAFYRRSAVKLLAPTGLPRPC